MFEYRKTGKKLASRAVSNRIYAKWYLFLGLYCITTFWLLCFLNHVQNGLYMDEVFHVPQLKSYCQGAFNKWDPKITTPPGLYIFTLIFTWPLSLLFGKPELCWNVSIVRGSMMLSSISIPLVVASILRLLHGMKDERDATAQMILSISSATFPVLYFFNFLYYTDILSTILALTTFWLYLRGNYTVSAFVGLLSVFFRQTNIMWVALCAIFTIFRTLKKSTKKKFSPNIVTSSKYFALLWNNAVQKSLEDFSSLSELIAALLKNVWAYAMVGVSFIIFIVMNDGIVLGDKSAHVAVLHFPQCLYFCAFTLFFTSPLLISQRSDFFRSLKRNYLFVATATIFGLVMVHFFTMAHPYLLADNRHYTFYIWKRVIDRFWWTRYALVPVYVIGALWIKHLMQDTDIVFRVFWVVCTLVCLVPQRLLEFRYYIIPFMLLRLHYKRATIWELLLEALLYMSINAVTVYLFVTKKIYWQDMDDYQRLMW